MAGRSVYQHGREDNRFINSSELLLKERATTSIGPFNSFINTICDMGHVCPSLPQVGRRDWILFQPTKVKLIWPFVRENIINWGLMRYVMDKPTHTRRAAASLGGIFQFPFRRRWIAYMDSSSRINKRIPSPPLYNFN